MRQHTGILIHLPSENPLQGGFCYVILRRPQAAGAQHHIIKPHHLPYDPAYGLSIIMHGAHLPDLPPGRRNHPRYIPRIGIGNLPYQQFVTYNDYTYFHVRNNKSEHNHANHNVTRA